MTQISTSDQVQVRKKVEMVGPKTKFSRELKHALSVKKKKKLSRLILNCTMHFLSSKQSALNIIISLC